MTVEALTAWLLAVMLSTVPPGKSKHPKEARETAEEGKARYAAIARALAEVSLDGDEASLYPGDHGREKSAALVLAIAYHESHWRKHVDLGIGRSGRYWCMMQIAVDPERGDGAPDPRKPAATPEGWTGEDLIASRHKCFRRALHILQNGRRVCRDSKDPHAFVNLYASGSCERGQKAVAPRIATLNEWLSAHPWPPPEEKKRAKK